MDREVLQLVDRDAIEVYRQEEEIEPLKGSQEKQVFEPSTTVYGLDLNSSHQSRLNV